MPMVPNIKIVLKINVRTKIYEYPHKVSTKHICQ